MWLCIFEPGQLKLVGLVDLTDNWSFCPEQSVQLLSIEDEYISVKVFTFHRIWYFLLVKLFAEEFQELFLAEVVPFLKYELFCEVDRLFLAEIAFSLLLAFFGDNNPVLYRDWLEPTRQEIAEIDML